LGDLIREMIGVRFTEAFEPTENGKPCLLVPPYEQAIRFGWQIMRQSRDRKRACERFVWRFAVRRISIR
jgi:hypothetical protein